MERSSEPREPSDPPQRTEAPGPKTRVLFVCGKNKWRSPTAEQVFSEYPGLECLSAGVSNDAPTPVSIDLVQWADVIFVMEPVHKTKLAARFRDQLGHARVICLNIPDKYREMDPALIELLKQRVPLHLR